MFCKNNTEKREKSRFFYAPLFSRIRPALAHAAAASMNPPANAGMTGAIRVEFTANLRFQNVPFWPRRTPVRAGIAMRCHTNDKADAPSRPARRFWRI